MAIKPILFNTEMVRRQWRWKELVQNLSIIEL